MTKQEIAQRVQEGGKLVPVADCTVEEISALEQIGGLYLRDEYDVPFVLMPAPKADRHPMGVPKSAETKEAGR